MANPLSAAVRGFQTQFDALCSQIARNPDTQEPELSASVRAALQAIQASDQRQSVRTIYQRLESDVERCITECTVPQSTAAAIQRAITVLLDLAEPATRMVSRGVNDRLCRLMDEALQSQFTNNSKLYVSVYRDCFDAAKRAIVKVLSGVYGESLARLFSDPNYTPKLEKEWLLKLVLLDLLFSEKEVKSVQWFSELKRVPIQRLYQGCNSQDKSQFVYQVLTNSNAVPQQFKEALSRAVSVVTIPQDEYSFISLYLSCYFWPSDVLLSAVADMLTDKNRVDDALFCAVSIADRTKCEAKVASLLVKLLRKDRSLGIQTLKAYRLCPSVISKTICLYCNPKPFIDGCQLIQAVYEPGEYLHGLRNFIVTYAGKVLQEERDGGRESREKIVEKLAELPPADRAPCLADALRKYFASTTPTKLTLSTCRLWIEKARVHLDRPARELIQEEFFLLAFFSDMPLDQTLFQLVWSPLTPFQQASVFRCFRYVYGDVPAQCERLSRFLPGIQVVKNEQIPLEDFDARYAACGELVQKRIVLEGIVRSLAASGASHAYAAACQLQEKLTTECERSLLMQELFYCLDFQKNQQLVEQILEQIHDPIVEREIIHTVKKRAEIENKRRAEEKRQAEEARLKEESDRSAQDLAAFLAAMRLGGAASEAASHDTVDD